MQQDLATGQSSYFLQVLQQAHKTMYPARQVPRTEEDLLTSGVTLTGYMERVGGFKNKQEAGMLMWMLAHCRRWCCWESSPDERIDPPSTVFLHEIFSCIFSWKAFLSLGPFAVECNDFGLLERGRAVSFEDKRGTRWEAQYIEGPRSRSAISEATTIAEENPVPTQTQAGGRLASKGQLKPCDQVGAVPRSDVEMRKASETISHDAMRNLGANKLPHRVPPTSRVIKCNSRCNQACGDTAPRNDVADPPVMTHAVAQF